MRRCSKCRCDLAADFAPRYCRRCHAAYQREWRKKQRLNLVMVADLALEVVSSAFGRGQDDAGPDDNRVVLEARAIEAIRRGDFKSIERLLAQLRKAHADEWADIDQQYGARA